MSKTNPPFPPGSPAAPAPFSSGLPRNATSPAAQLAFLLGAVPFTAAVGTHLIAYGASSLVRRICRHFNPPPPPAPPKPPISLRGLPSPEDIQDAWDAEPRTLAARLRIGSRLADLEPTLDSRFVFKKTRSGSKRIVARQPGMKGWLRRNAPDVTYSTAMHYKKLATRLRQLVGLDARIPLEWILPGDGEARARLADLAPAERAAATAARRKLAALLADNPKITHLTLAVEQKLGIMRMVTIRRIRGQKAHRIREGKRDGKREKRPTNSLISQVNFAGMSANVDPVRAGAFWDAIRKILGEERPDAATRKLQYDIRTWLNAPLQARQNRRR